MSDDPGHISKEQWAAYQAQQPKGFVLVPKEPTEHMRIAGFESDAWDALGHAVLAKKGWPYSCRESAECVAGIFRAMLAAAPVAAPESTCDAARVIEWAQSNPRPPASVAFTAGPERQAAYWIEWAQRQQAASLDIEAMLTACVPGGSSCDPQQVADAIREWVAKDGSQAQAAETEILAWLMHDPDCDGYADWVEKGSARPADRHGFEAIPLGRIGVAKQSSSAPAPGGHCGFFSREAALESSLRVAVDSDLGRRWLYPDTARETWFDEARTALAQQASQAPAEAHSKFPAPDLRGIDAATHHEWRMLGVPAKEMLIQGKDLPEIIKRACLTYVASNPQPKGTEPVELPPGLSRSDAEFWLRKRGEIIEALRAEGLTMVTTLNGVQFMRLGKIEAQAAQAPAVTDGKEQS